MADTGPGPSEPTTTTPADSGTAEPGFLHIEEKDEAVTTSSTTASDKSTSATATSLSQVPLVTLVAPRTLEPPGTVEHLAARRPVAELTTSTPEMKQRFNELQAEVTRLVTGMRWGGASIDETAEHLLPLLDLGPVLQWKPVLIPFLLEIDRSGSLTPVWVKIIEREEPQDLPPSANPAETPVGRARRYAIMMLGNYKASTYSEQGKAVGFARLGAGKGKTIDVTRLLGQLATDPNTSLYATRALSQQGTVEAIQALAGALKEASGWAKVDVVEACLDLKQVGFYDLLMTSGLDRVPGLESYVAIPLYRSIPLESYFHTDSSIVPRLSQQSALILAQVLLDSMNPAQVGTEAVPIIFERPLPTIAQALFANARSNPNWQNIYAMHRLGTFLGRYWADISRGQLQDPRILEPVYACLPMMPDVERWMDGPGRDVLLKTLPDSEDEGFIAALKVLGELRDPRAIPVLIDKIDATNELTSREQALQAGALCDTLGRLGDRRAVSSMLQLISRVIDVTRRSTTAQLRDNLPAGDADIPGSIVYAAVVRACGQLNDRSALESIIRAINDFDPYVRTQAIEALKRLDPTGEDVRSRIAARKAMTDSRDSVVRTACQLAARYRDNEAVPLLHHIVETRPELAPAAYDALRQLS